MYNNSSTALKRQRHFDAMVNELARAARALRDGEVYEQQVEAERIEGLLDAVLGREW